MRILCLVFAVLFGGCRLTLKLEKGFCSAGIVCSRGLRKCTFYSHIRVHSCGDGVWLGRMQLRLMINMEISEMQVPELIRWSLFGLSQDR